MCAIAVLAMLLVCMLLMLLLDHERDALISLNTRVRELEAEGRTKDTRIHMLEVALGWRKECDKSL